MKKNSHKPLFLKSCLGLLTAWCLTACSMYEHPALTEDGEKGVDPTEVTVKVKVALKWGEEGNPYQLAGTTESCRHRVIVDAYLDRVLSKRQVAFAEASDDRQTEADITIKLHARDYQLVVWSDYVQAGSEEDLYYNTASLAPVAATDNYLANSEYKQAFYACRDLPLSKYGDRWNATISWEPEMKQPMARYELIANDVERFMAQGAKSGEKYTMSVRYLGFYNTGFHTLDGVSKRGLQYISYNRTITVPAAGTKELSVGFDYVFVPENGDIPLAVELKDAQGNLLARTYLTLTVQQGDRIVKRSNFLTADPSGGIGIDGGYDGTIDEDLTVE